MNVKSRTSDSRRRATSLVEVVVALTALAIIVVGHSLNAYNARLDIQRAVWRSTAVTMALTLSESWVAAKGSPTYDAVAALGSQMTITTGGGPEAPSGFTSHGSYAITVDGISYSATLSSGELDPTLRALNVTVAWSDRNTTPPAWTWTFPLTTYVVLD
jgi:Tfp pilus assembly protein PilV